MSNINAAKQPWIPVVSNSGDATEVSLVQVFTESEEYATLAVDSWASLAFTNLLVAVAMAACRPKDEGEILSYLGNKSSLCSAVQGYLVREEESFWLHHTKRPLFQVACLDKGAAYRATGDLEVESLKTSLLRSPRLYREARSPAGLLRMLLVSQVCGGNLKYGVTRPGGCSLLPTGRVQDFQTGVSELISTNGGSTSTQNFRIGGQSLLETVILNMLPEDKVLRTWGDQGLGKPSWEYDWDDHTVVTARAQEHTHSFLGRLIPVRKFLWVDVEDPARMIYGAAEGLDYHAPLQALKGTKQYDSSYYLAPRGLEDPKVKAALGALPDEVPLWKEFASLKGSMEFPGVLDKLRSYQGPIRIVSTSMQVSSSMGLVYLERCQVSAVEWPPGAFNNFITGLPTLNSMVTSADVWGKKIRGALSTYNRIMGIDPKGKISEQNLSLVRTSFWKGLGNVFSGFLAKIGDPGVLGEWEASCLSIAVSAVHETLRGLGSRRNKAVALAVSQLKQ